MPLSDREQEILQQIERGLIEEDPGFGRRVLTRGLKIPGNVKGGVALFVLGFACLLGFLLTTAIGVGVAAFFLMLAGATIAVQGARTIAARSVEGVSQPLKRIIRPLEERFRGNKHKDDE